MAVNQGVPGVGATLLNNGQQVSPTNPLPVTGAGGSALPAGVTLGEQLTFVLVGTAVGSNALVAAVPGKRIFVTGYNFSLAAAAIVFFSSNANIISAQGNNVVGGNEAIGGEPFLFNTVAGEALNFNTTVAGAGDSVQVRYRVEV